jgi:hypothetical protein
LLAVILVIAYSCSTDAGAGDRKARQQGSSSASPEPSASVLSPSNEPTGVPVVPENPGTSSSPAGGSAGHGANATGTCADAELSVTPEPEVTSARQGVPVRLMIKIKNVSARTCVRDLGAEMQEIYLQQGTTKQWSSDACIKRGAPGSDVRTFPPSHEFSYWVIWDGKTTAQGCENQQWLAKGAYQIVGRLGTKVSDPVAFTVTG